MDRNWRKSKHSMLGKKSPVLAVSPAAWAAFTRRLK